MTPEAKVKKAVKKMLDDRGAYYFMPATGGYGRSGVPDIVGCHKGIFFGIECKAGDNQPTALQLRELDKIQMHEGYISIVNEKNLLQVEVMLDCIEAERNASQDQEMSPQSTVGAVDACAERAMGAFDKADRQAYEGKREQCETLHRKLNGDSQRNY